VWRTLRRRVTLLFLWISESILSIVGRRRPYGVLTLEVSGDLSEDGGEQRVLGFLRRPSTDYFSLVSLLRWARDDEQLQGVLLSCNDVRASWARLQGLRRAIEKLRAAGKPVWIHLNSAGVGEYYLATAADRISLAPAGNLDVAGLSSEAMFFLGSLEKLGIQADVIQMGRYKAAAEPFTRKDMSPEHREMMESLVDDLYGQLIEGVTAGRGLDPNAARELLDRGPFMSKEALELGLVDRLVYEDEVEDELVEACGGATKIDRQAYSRRRGREVQKRALQHHRGTLGVLHVCGTIKSGESIPGPEGANGVGSATLADALGELRERDDISAVVLRVASPGGSGLASDLIWRELVRTREKKPVVVSFGDVAASGGYYIGVAGTPVFAEAGSITGSIGVIAGKANLRGLYDRLGVTKELVTRGKHAKIYSDYLPLEGEERARLQAEAESFYDIFLDKVADARKLSREATEAVAEGRVWTGRQAWTRGLVDELGGIEEALDAAKKLVGIPVDQPVSIERFPRPRRLWKLAVDFNLPNQSRMAADLVSLLPALRFVVRERVWAVLPFHLRFF
jgi:protease-4